MAKLKVELYVHFLNSQGFPYELPVEPDEVKDGHIEAMCLFSDADNMMVAIPSGISRLETQVWVKTNDLES